MVPLVFYMDCVQYKRFHLHLVLVFSILNLIFLQVGAYFLRFN